MTDWEANPDGYVTNGPGTMKKGDRIRLIGYQGEDRLLEVLDVPVTHDGTVSLQVRQIEP